MSPEVARVTRNGLAVHPLFSEFVENELVPAAGLDAAAFWQGFAALVAELTTANRELLARRDSLQSAIDDWHRQHPPPWDHEDYATFLKSIGYLEDEGAAFTIATDKVDPEIASVAGPQLVVPVSNARFALNACNARWGSLYDALYGSDVIAETDGRQRDGGYNPERGAAVIDFAAGFLDTALPLDGASHRQATGYRVEPGSPASVVVELEDGGQTTLADPAQFAGHSQANAARQLLFVHHGLHFEILIDPEHPVGRDARSGVADIVLESAITTIQDCEDSVAAVDAEDKTAVYRNWLGLQRGDLSDSFTKEGRSVTRRLAVDRHYHAPDGTPLTLSGRSLMLVRNVGLHMTTDTVLDGDGAEVFEGLIDALVTSAATLADRRADGRLPNSRFGSVYIVKPKLHGAAEALFTDQLFARVETILGLEPNTIKVGIMDEERRTSANLAACIHAVRKRIVFINTGFLDRTGDEIHTAMHAGPVFPKETIKSQAWLQAYEDRNVDTGIRCGLPGRAQIGKGMWPQPDNMQRMLETKQSQLEAGASCAWVPSPTAATLHAMHYHAVDVRARQQQLATRAPASLDAMLRPPLTDAGTLGDDEIQAELDNNVQGILGYVVRWIDQGIGCSKVPDIHHTGLMEDRATLRISSQHIANWLMHGVIAPDQVDDTLRRMARIVDRQNAADPAYRNLGDDPDNCLAFQCARQLIFRGATEPNGYTEALLHAYRRRAKHRAPA